MSESLAPNHNQIRTVAAGAIIGALVGIPASSPETFETSSPYEDAIQIAQRYECDVKSVEDLGLSGEVSPGSGIPRSNVRVTLTLNGLPEAQSALDRYQEDDTVIWFAPAIGGSIEDEYGRTPVFHDRFLEGPQPEGSTYIVDFQPLSENAEGTQIDLVLHNDVTYLGDDHATEIDGYKPCGTMIYQDGQWSLSGPSNMQPTIDTINIPYQ